MSANHYVCPEGYGVERFLDEAVEAGFGHVALTRAALSEMTSSALRRAVEARGLSVTTLNSAGYFTWSDPERTQNQIEENLRLIDAAAELSADTLCVITGGCSELADVASARARIEAGLAELDARSTDAGVHLGLEPIHPKDVATKGCVNSIAQARALVAPLTSTGLIVDFCHSWWDPDLVAVAGDRDLRVLQICNVRPDLGRSATLDAGMLNVGAVLDEMRRAGAGCAVEFEIFAADHGQSDVAPILRAAARWARA